MNRKVNLITFSSALRDLSSTLYILTSLVIPYSKVFVCRSTQKCRDAQEQNRNLLFVCGQDSWCTLKPSFETISGDGQSPTWVGDRPSLAHALYH